MDAILSSVINGAAGAIVSEIVKDGLNKYNKLVALDDVRITDEPVGVYVDMWDRVFHSDDINVDEIEVKIANNSEYDVLLCVDGGHIHYDCTYFEVIANQFVKVLAKDSLSVKLKICIDYKRWSNCDSENECVISYTLDGKKSKEIKFSEIKPLYLFDDKFYSKQIKAASKHILQLRIDRLSKDLQSNTVFDILCKLFEKSTKLRIEDVSTFEYKGFFMNMHEYLLKVNIMCMENIDAMLLENYVYGVLQHNDIFINCIVKID